MGAVDLGPNTTTVTKYVTASVLIVSQPEDAPVPEIKSIRISPSSIVVDRGETIRLSASAFGADGRPMRDVKFTWVLVDPRSGNLSKDGRFRAGPTPGTFPDGISVTAVQNTASGIQNASARASVVVVGESSARKLASVAILPNSPVVTSGQIYRLWAAGFDEEGKVIPGVSFVWRVNDISLGRMNNIGYLTVSGSPGTYPDAVTVTAIWEGVRQSATTPVTVYDALEAADFFSVQVLPQRFYLDRGDRLQLQAVALNGLGELVAGTELRWSMVNPQAGTIHGNGMFVAGDLPGVYTEAVKVEAIVKGEQGFVRAFDLASVVVRSGEHSSRRLEALRVLPQAIVISPGARMVLGAQAFDEFGSRAENVTTSWQVQLAGVGEITSRGSFKATGTPGVYPAALVVTGQQRQGDQVIERTESVDVIITGTLSHLEVQPSLATVGSGRTVHFSVIGRDENGIELSGLAVRWSLADKSIGKIDASGNFTAAKAPGIYQDAIRAEVRQAVPVF